MTSFAILLPLLLVCGRGTGANACNTTYEYAICQLQPDPGAPVTVTGTVDIRQAKDCSGRYGVTEYWLRASGLPVTSATTQRGFHIHQFADFTSGCSSAGPHYNPRGMTHGDITSPTRHVGDLGNVVTFANGSINTVISDTASALHGPRSVFGRAMVLHANQDDLGLGGNEESLKTGNAGPRYACCVIGRANGSRWQ